MPLDVEPEFDDVTVGLRPVKAERPIRAKALSSRATSGPEGVYITSW